MIDVTVVITNYKRPGNVRHIIPEFRKQTIKPAKVIVVDNSPVGSDFVFPESDEAYGRYADDIIRFGIDAGPPCRFAAIPLIETDAVLFYDDDMLPGPGCIENLLNEAESLGWEFATLGEIGRHYKRCPKSKRYGVRVRNVKRSENPVRVDMTCRAHFCQTKHLHFPIALRTFCRQDGCEPAELRSDDIFLSQGIQTGSGFPSYLTRACPRDSRIKVANLPSPFAQGARADHRSSRDFLINRAAKWGWSFKR